MGDKISPRSCETSSARQEHDHAPVAMPLSSPPSTAGSSAETITTNDEDARRCNEWELFTEFDHGTRPSSEQESRSSTANTYTRSSISSPQSQLADPDSDHGCDSPSDSEDGGSDGGGHGNMQDSESLIDSNEETEETQVRDDVIVSSARQQSLGVDIPDEDRTPGCPLVASIMEATEPEASCASVPPSARSALSSSSSARPDLSPASSSRIQVYVRIRPQSRGESDAEVVVRSDGANGLRVTSLATGSITESVVDGVFADRSTQLDMFAAVNPGIRAALEGMNATIFAYGQTGTGKTFTMFGDDTEPPASGGPTSDISHGWGLIPRALWELCSHTSAPDTVSRVQLSCSFLQIYNDRVFDLLTDRRRQKPLVLREQPSVDGGTNVVLQGLSSETVQTFSEALQLVRRGRMNRSVRETESNACSSRSHAIVQLNLLIETPLPNGDKRVRTSRLNLVDLAGSEKWNTDIDMEDHHAAELKNINVSLSALGNCIAALAETGRRHIPYRDSTLTRLLQDSFGGNALAFLIATISPSQKASEETIRTLQFADRARSVMQVVRVNESFSGCSELLAAKAQIKTLRQRLSVEQRRRHETRINEQDALERVFAAKLQEKDDELKRVRRDNEVFTKWRDEDVKRIRALESRIKELEIPQEPTDHGQHWGPTTKTLLTPQFNLCDLECNQSVEHVRASIPQHHGPESESKTLTKKKSIRTKKNPATESAMPEAGHERSQKSRGRSYRSLIDKYSSHSKKQNAVETHPNGQRSYAAATPTQKKTPVEQPHHGNAATDAQSPQKRLVLPRSSSDTLFTSTSQSTSLGVSIERSYASYASDKSTVLTGLANNAKSFSGISNQVGLASLWKTESLPLLTKVDPVPSGPSHHPAPYASVPAYQGVQAWQLPVVQSNTLSTETPSLTRSEATSQVCGKHSLKGCVLCAVNDPPPMSTIAISTTTEIKATSPLILSSSITSSAPSATVETRSPCERHQLPGCFICMKSTSDTSWRLPVSSTPSLASALATTTSGSAFPRMDATAGHRPLQDTKCSAHMLANCVLCAGTNPRIVAPTLPPSLESFASSTKRSIPFDASAAWRSNPVSTMDAGSHNEFTMSRSLFDQPYAKPSHSYGQATGSSMDGFRGESENRMQFYSLVREATDAASVALRRRA